jgi:hypothetical protein
MRDASVTLASSFATDNVVVLNTSVTLSGTVLLNVSHSPHRIRFTAFDLSGNSNSCSYNVTVLATGSAAASSAATAAGAVGGGLGFFLILLVVLAFLLLRYKTRRIQELEEREKFKENDEWVLARAMAIQAAMAKSHGDHKPETRELGANTRRALNVSCIFFCFFFYWEREKK